MLFMQKQLSQKCNRVNETETVAIFKTLDHTLRFTLHKYKQVIKVTKFYTVTQREGWCAMTVKKKKKQSNIQLCTQSTRGNQSPLANKQ